MVLSSVFRLFTVIFIISDDRRSFYHPQRCLVSFQSFEASGGGSSMRLGGWRTQSWTPQCNILGGYSPPRPPVPPPLVVWSLKRLMAWDCFLTTSLPSTSLLLILLLAFSVMVTCQLLYVIAFLSQFPRAIKTPLLRKIIVLLLWHHLSVKH